MMSSMMHKIKSPMALFLRSRYECDIFNFSTSINAASKNLPPRNHYDRFVWPMTLLPEPLHNTNVAEYEVMKMALFDYQNTQKKKNDDLQWLLNKMQCLKVPATPEALSSITPLSREKLQHSFQVMNRNARKAKRANHGKRPCSRVRRRWKTRKWANPSRRG